MSEDVSARRPAGIRWRQPDTWWSVLRAVLLLFWVASTALTWWSTPREADAGQATADLAGGRVTDVQWGDEWRGDSGAWHWNDQRFLRSAGSNSPILAWRTDDWRVHYTVTGAYETVTIDRPEGSAGYADAQAAELGRAVAAAGLQPGSVTDAAPRSLTSAMFLVIGGSVVVLLLFGPAPVTGTRWFWWWLITWMPLGLGALWWLARERPWSRTAEPPSGPPDRENRRRWYVALGLSFLASVLVTMVTFVLHRFLGDGIVPQPGG